MVLLLIQFITIPLDVLTYKLRVMDQFEAGKNWKHLRNTLDVLSIFDIICNFFTGYVDKYKKEVIMEPRKVAR